MSAPQKFRSALNGFNREDVASYLEYLNSKHTAQVNQLTSEAEFLRAKLDAVQPADDQHEHIRALESERDSLHAQLEELKAYCANLEQALEEARNTTAASAVVPTAPVSCSASEELEIYRRAERTERMARERADMVYRQANGILNEASVRVSEMADQVVPIADQILMQINQLQNTVNTTKQSLQDAVVIINTLRPDNT
jgi:DNA repair exonuclease SbcCD ATPase subunit